MHSSSGYTQEGSKVVPAAISGPNVVNLAIDSDTDMEVAAVESSKRGEKEDGEEGKKPSPGSAASYATLPLTGTLPLSPSEANRLKNPLLRLRQACVHPQVIAVSLCFLITAPMMAALADRWR